MAMVATAKGIWDTSDVKNRIRETIYKKPQNNWDRDVLQYVLNHSKSLSRRLPPKFQNELEEAIILVGEEIHNWNKYLLEALRLDFRYAEVTYLTSSGLMDGSQILENYWLLNRTQLNSGFLDLICMFGPGSLVFKSRYEIVDHLIKKFELAFAKSNKTFEKKIKNELYRLEDKTQIVEFVLANWLNLQYKYLDPNDDFGIGFPIESLPLSAEQISSFGNRKKILLITFGLGCTHLFKFFLKKWFHTADLDIIFDSVKELCDQIFYGDKELSNYERKKHLEMILMITNATSKPKKVEIMENHGDVFLKLSYLCWPDLEPVIDDLTWNMAYYEVFQKILKTIAEKEVEDRDRDLIKKGIYRSVFRDVLNVLLENLNVSDTG